MTDLSYTNKDGLNLYEGFNNGFDYHRDGKADGDGYEHGGYPEIIGETSEYTDTSYKTGDNPDFFDNGNVWVQPSVNPGPSPTPTPTYIELFEIGSASQIAVEGIDNPYGRREEGGIPYWEPNILNCNYSPEYDETSGVIDGNAFGVSDYPVTWGVLDNAYWDSLYDGVDLREIISSPYDLTALKLKVNCNGTEMILPIIKDTEYQSTYYAGQAEIGSYTVEYEEALSLWTHPFRIALSERETKGVFDIRVSVRMTEDVALNDITLVKEED